MKHLKTILTVFLALLTLITALPVQAADYGEGEYLYLRSGELSEGQINIVRRARQLVEIEWTPVYNLPEWDREGTFWAGTTYAGVPYGQPVHGAYVGYGCAPGEFIKACDDGNSRMYKQLSQFNKVSCIYSTDCSAFVSYCWDLKYRKTTRNISDVAELVGDQSVNGLEVGDCLDDIYNHVILVTGVVRNSAGEVTLVETMEETPALACRKIYGSGELSLDKLVSEYLENGYKVYRYKNRDSVTYTHDCAVPIDGDYCPKCRDRAPAAATTAGEGCKTVELTAGADAVIHYTTDGSEPTTDSPIYTSALSFDTPTMLRAIAWTGNFSGARTLSYYVNVEPCAAPAYTVSGMSRGTEVSYGAEISLYCDTQGAQIYYTTNGADPLTEGRLYERPLTVEADTQVRASAKANGYRDSAPSAFDFKIKKFSSFTDVPADAWYARAVEYVYSMNVFSGTGTRSFSPDAEMTRGMFVSVLGRMAGVTPETSREIGIVKGDGVGLFAQPDAGSAVLASPGRGGLVLVLGSENGWYKAAWGAAEGYIFGDYLTAYAGAYSDVDVTAYYSPYVQWAYLTGISGCASGAFRPDERISRQDLAAMLYNYAKVTGISLAGTDSGAVFTDDADISPENRDAVFALARAGVMNGMGDGRFNPNAGATRAQVAQIMMNFLMSGK